MNRRIRIDGRCEGRSFEGMMIEITDGTSLYGCRFFHCDIRGDSYTLTQCKAHSCNFTLYGNGLLTLACELTGCTAYDVRGNRLSAIGGYAGQKLTEVKGLTPPGWWKSLLMLFRRPSIKPIKTFRKATD